MTASITSDETFKRGLAQRKAVVGEARVTASLERSDALSRPLQEAVTRFAFGEVWARPELDARARSIATIAILIALRAKEELRVHIAGGIRNGLTAVEVRELVMHAAVYAGFPAALSAMEMAREALQECSLTCD
jgi:4-carboxymuconolactone decarboxylase